MLSENESKVALKAHHAGMFSMIRFLRRYHLKETLPIAFLVTLVFYVCYGAANWIALRNPTRYTVHFPFELSFPFIPASAIAYLSIQLLFALVLFVFPSKTLLWPIAWTMIFEIFTASIVFIVAPVQLGFPEPHVVGRYEFLFRLADSLNLDLNSVPSLHVALAVTCAEILAQALQAKLKWCVRLWASMIVLSTVLLHQHHLLDVALGLFLAQVSLKFIYKGLASPDAGSADLRRID